MARDNFDRDQLSAAFAAFQCTATLNRAALNGAELVDVVVVYKVDRLTRSLADFANMVEMFDPHHVSLVAATQQFNTTTSMGRITLNVLLSFAQFEVAVERIQDKIAAPKGKGSGWAACLHSA